MRASATMPMRRIRLPIPKRPWNQRVDLLPGWYRSHNQASSTIGLWIRRDPALLISCSLWVEPLSYGVGAKPAQAANSRRFLNFYRWSLRIFDPADLPIHKRFEFLDFIEDSFKLHLRSFFSVDGCVVSPSSQNGSVRCTFLICLNNCCIPPVDPVGERPESVGRRWATWMLSTGYPHVPKGEGRSVGLVH
uniref:Uncharacterized protein n=1 Tax=Candidatus Kentrum sp. TC TaxID=2126339 RepID=A0A450YED9_9GAMM|nr:MAG: hypothetical protein BECKTC1821D_GA0114238_100751 [Candidatus Kentron sp. TC]